MPWTVGPRTAAAAGMALSVAQFPPGTSKWNRTGHRIFSQITQNWRGRPLASHQVIVQLTAAAAAGAGRTIRAERSEPGCPPGIKASGSQMKSLDIRRDLFRGEWNCTLMPQS